jgi:hypothetical protein
MQDGLPFLQDEVLEIARVNDLGPRYRVWPHEAVHSVARGHSEKTSAEAGLRLSGSPPPGRRKSSVPLPGSRPSSGERLDLWARFRTVGGTCHRRRCSLRRGGPCRPLAWRGRSPLLRGLLAVSLDGYLVPGHGREPLRLFPLGSILWERVPGLGEVPFAGLVGLEGLLVIAGGGLAGRAPIRDPDSVCGASLCAGRLLYRDSWAR